jgi:hypothetical protein
LRDRVEAYLSSAAKLYKIYKKNEQLSGGTAEKDFVEKCKPLYPEDS